MKAAYAAVDWGTSSFRLWLVAADGSVLDERRSHEGMVVATGCGFGKILHQHLADLSQPSDLPVVICGMAGARQGWVEAGYLTLPEAIDGIPSSAVRVPGEARVIHILPGLAQRDRAAPDVMRGEETQILGALDERPDAASLFCMPGTHSKWVHLDGRRVTRFSTFMTGELYDVLSKHSILAHSLAGARTDDGFDRAAFLDAVAEAFDAPAAIANRLFTIRSGQLLHGLTPNAAAARLSGLLIGTEIAGALSGAPRPEVIGLIASGRLAGLYAEALDSLGFPVQAIDADGAVRRGLAVAAHHLAISKEPQS